MSNECVDGSNVIERRVSREYYPPGTRLVYKDISRGLVRATIVMPHAPAMWPLGTIPDGIELPGENGYMTMTEARKLAKVADIPLEEA